MHDEVFGRQSRPEPVEGQRRQEIDQKNRPVNHHLQQADAGAVAEEIVGLGVERDLGDAVKGGKERRELRGLVDERMDGRGIQSSCD